MARYTDGAPVVFGPFGGDQPTPAEVRLMRAFLRRQECWRSRHRLLARVYLACGWTVPPCRREEHEHWRPRA